MARAPQGSRAQQLSNISTGGFACTVDEPLPVGCLVNLRIPLIWPDYRGCGVVAWCRELDPAYEVGIQFGAQHVFSAKMVEQLAQIEEYRLQLYRCEGRTLSNEQAAFEWIALYAEDFAEFFMALDESIDNKANEK
jgi:hypothetical protein